MYLRAHPKTHQIYLDDEKHNIIYSFDGTPLKRPDVINDWPTVNTNDVPSLFSWQSDPWHYGTLYMVSRINLNDTSFTAGGAQSYIEAWAKERELAFIHLAAYFGRNAARINAEVQW